MSDINTVNSRAGLHSNQIKLIAILAMTIDHLAWLFVPGCQHIWWVIGLHTIGRITAPIMWFFIAEGYFYTRNKAKYTERLFLSALISHFAYNFAAGIPFVPTGILNQTSVMWSLTWSVVLLGIVNTEKYPNWIKYAAIAAVCLITFPSDWSCIAAMCPVFLYSHRGNFKKQAIDILIWTSFYAVVFFFTIDPVYGMMQFGTLLSLPILRCYNGQRGSWKGMKWLFYIYYPAHLFLIGIIRLMLGNGPIFP